MNRILMLLFMCMPVMLWAQRLPVHEKQKELQERMVEVSLSEIQERLSLTEMQISQLRPVYKQYQKKVARLNMQNHKLFNRMNADTLSDEQAKTIIVCLKQAVYGQFIGNFVSSTSYKIVSIRFGY